MYKEPFLKLITDNKDKRFVTTDNYHTYFTISDFRDQFDGLWSGGFHLFNSIVPLSNNCKIKNKSHHLPVIESCFDNNLSLKFYLFKKSQGLLVSFINNNFMAKKVKRYSSFVKVSSQSNIMDIAEDSFILKYDKPERLGFGFDNYYCAFLSTGGYTFKDVSYKNSILNFNIIPTQDSLKEPEILILYSDGLAKLKKMIDYSKNKTTLLKKQHIKNSLLPFTYTSFETDNKTFDKALVWATYSANGFVMRKNETIGLWAGLQWFDNSWGRDTFISLPGVSLVSGRYEEAKHIIVNFVKYQCNSKKSEAFGKIPNVIFSEDKIIFNTADATPLLVREIYEYFLHTGDINFILNMWQTIKLVIEAQYIAKKDDNHFVPQKDADDWMDAKKDDKYPYSPRGDKAIEIQALWYVALYVAFNIGKEIVNYREVSKMPLPDNIRIDELKKDIVRYKNLADNLKVSFNKFFISSQEPYIYDHINIDYSFDTKTRPNPLLAVYYSTMLGIPSLFERDKIIKFLKFALPKIVYKFGVSSLDKNDEDFHPINNSTLFHKDAAYHNGMIWLFLSGTLTNSLASFGLQNFVFRHTESLVSQILDSQALGTLSELLYPYQKDKNSVTPSGTYSQTWSISEFCRSFYRDYLGINLNVPKRKIFFTPALPMKFGFVKTKIRYGYYETLHYHITNDKESDSISSIDVKAIEINRPIFVILKIRLGYEKFGTKYKYKTLFTKIKLSENGDLFKIEFTRESPNLIKLKNLDISSHSEVMSVEIGSEVSEIVYEDGLKYARPINDEELKKYKSMTVEKYLEKKITKKSSNE